MSSRQRVLIVNGLSETEEVLKALLEPRGLEIQRIRSRCLPDALADASPPQVVVIDLDEDALDSEVVDQWQNTRRVLIGSALVASSDEDEHLLPKPFHYGELIRAVERLLADGPRRDP